MKTKAYPNTTKRASRLGFGAWPLGNTAHGMTMGVDEGVDLVRRAFNEGVTFFDTAPNYALGRSETILGQALRDVRDEVIINTKFGHDANDVIDFSEERIEPSIQSSLKRLQTDYLDSVLLHNPSSEVLRGETGHFKILEKLKRKGTIHAYGVSVDTPEELNWVLQNDGIEVVEVLFNILSQQNRTMFKALKERGIAIIIKVPLDSGWLTGKYTKDSAFTDIRSRWTGEVKARREKLVTALKDTLNPHSMTDMAMRFIWAFDEVTTVIPGIRTVGQLMDHLRAEKDSMDPEDVQKAMDFYDEHIKGDPLPW